MVLWKCPGWRIRMLCNQKEGCDVRHAPLPVAPFFFLAKMDQDSSGIALSLLIWVSGSRAAAEPCPLLLVAPHSPCWDLAAARARARTSIPTPPHCCPPGKRTCHKLYNEVFKEVFQRKGRVLQFLCPAAETPVMLPGFISCSAKAPASHWSPRTALLLSQSHVPHLSSGPNTSTCLGRSLQLVLPALYITLLTSSL